MKKLRETLEPMLKGVEKRFHEKPQRVIDAFFEIVGKEIAMETKVERFEKGVLHVSVDNSTLLSLLRKHEKERILKELRQRFPDCRVIDLSFRMKQFGKS